MGTIDGRWDPCCARRLCARLRLLVLGFAYSEFERRGLGTSCRLTGALRASVTAPTRPG